MKFYKCIEDIINMSNRKKNGDLKSSVIKRAVKAVLGSKDKEVKDTSGTCIVYEFIDSDSNPKDLVGCKKPRLSLVPPTGIIHEAKAFENGADKYGAYNYRDKKVQALIYIDAALRHIYSYLDGEQIAEDSGVHHLGHARACLNILLDAEENGFLIDNRPRKGKSPELIKRLEKK